MVFQGFKKWLRSGTFETEFWRELLLTGDECPAMLLLKDDRGTLREMFRILVSMVII